MMKSSTMNGRQNGRVTAASARSASELLRYLPAIYDDSRSETPFLARFLLIFETLWAPIEGQIDHLAALFDPHLTPPELLPWLAQWVCLTLDEPLAITGRPEPVGDILSQRELVANMVSIYARFGTAGALRDYLKLYLGVEPRILDETDETGQELAAFHFRVLLPLARPADPVEAADLDRRIRRIIARAKPAHTTYDLVYDPS